MYFLEARVPTVIQHYEHHHVFDKAGELLKYPLIPPSSLSTAWKPLACSENRLTLLHLAEKYEELHIKTRIIEEEHT